MTDYTTPIEATFELQRQAVEGSHQAMQQGVEFQKRMNEAALEGFEAAESTQRNVVELQREAFHSMLDAVEANVPGAVSATDELRDMVDEGYDELLDVHSDTFDTFLGEYEGSMDTQAEMTEEYLDAMEEQFDLLLEAHEEIEDQSVEATEQVGEQVGELQEQMEEVQAQIRDVSERAADAVEA
jgi:methyl-accepting chemotaxis protein